MHPAKHGAARRVNVDAKQRTLLDRTPMYDVIVVGARCAGAA